ncbi:GNAT family N-acetyltransferase [Corynebacterium canis]|uniref:GNAT family N-acetyltransferase n=1 Tax=Corynebacterium canis TaxID=679663 RepID=A0A5C5UEC2_9CORY|nr:GNAT family N-acetyltransferase [Corynebacterium canis]TWT24514.1 GNAT family N-acetyltransferase [Corynebacterium canis]WJY76304.1 Mycothiol acetyltransferase [Corynebacterium canis]
MNRAPQLGDRVIVRRHVPGSAGHLSDIIGHVLDLDPLTVRPQAVGGLPSDKDAVVIPAEQVQVCKVLPPRRVRNSDIRAVEQATAAAFPGTEHIWHNGWLLRAGDGITERSNSAAPLGSSAGLSQVPLEAIREFYRRQNMPTRILLPDRIARSAEVVCAKWKRGPDILVMTRPLDTIDVRELPEGYEFRVDDQPDEAWLNMYHFRGKPLPVHALNLLRTSIEGHMGFGRLTCGDSTVAITRGTVTYSEDGRAWLGYSAVEVAPAYRRRGLGTALGHSMLHWGRSLGASAAYLQVISSNTPGIELYKTLGFIEHHRHRYAEEG